MGCASSVASRIGTGTFGEFTLTAEQYADGTPDWHNVDLDGAVRPRRRVRRRRPGHHPHCRSRASDRASACRRPHAERPRVQAQALCNLAAHVVTANP